MGVSLRIVGIYYHQDNIPYTSGMTVKSVLDYAKSNPIAEMKDLSGNIIENNAKSFGYQQGKLIVGRNKGDPSVSSFYAEYEQPFKSQTGDIPRSPGVYYLPEELPQTSSPPKYQEKTFTAWQYYVFDKPLQSRGATYQVNVPRIETFDKAIVPKGGFVVWRLCKILNGSNSETPPYIFP